MATIFVCNFGAPLDDGAVNFWGAVFLPIQCQCLTILCTYRSIDF